MKRARPSLVGHISLQKVEGLGFRLFGAIGAKSDQDGFLIAADVRMRGLESHQKAESHGQHSRTLRGGFGVVDGVDHHGAGLFHEQALNLMVLNAVHLGPARVGHCHHQRRQSSEPHRSNLRFGLNRTYPLQANPASPQRGCCMMALAFATSFPWSQGMANPRTGPSARQGNKVSVDLLEAAHV
jgi:hypothetical protein